MKCFGIGRGIKDDVVGRLPYYSHDWTCGARTGIRHIFLLKVVYLSTYTRWFGDELFRPWKDIINAYGVGFWRLQHIYSLLQSFLRWLSVSRSTRRLVSISVTC